MSRRPQLKKVERAQFDARAAGAACGTCPRFAKGCQPINPGPPREGANVLVLWGAPNRYEDRHGKPITTENSRVVDKGLNQAGISAFTSTYATLCRAPDGETDAERSEAARACYPRLQREIDAFKTSAAVPDGVSPWILSLGPEAFEALTGRDDFTKWLGGPATTQSGVPYLPTFSPSYVNSPAGAPYIPAFYMHLVRVAGLASGTMKPWRWPENVIVPGPEMKRQLQGLLAETNAGIEISVDIETNKAGTRFWCIGFASDNYACSVPIGSYDELCRAIVASPGPKILQNGNFDIGYLKSQGWEVGGEHLDTLWQHCLTNPSTSHALGMLSAFELSAPAWKAEWRQGSDDKGMSAFDLHDDDEAAHLKLREYNQRDAVAQLKIHQSLMEKLYGWPQGPELYALSRRVNKIGLKMTKVGLKRKEDNVQRLKLWLQTELDQSLEQMAKAAARFGVKDFSPASGKSMADLFFGAFRMAPVKWTPKGKPSLDEDALGVYMTQGDNEAAAQFATALTVFRNKQKVISTYLDGLRPGPDGRIHPAWRAALLTSGRWSSRPNVQNWPGYVRLGVEAEEGYTIVAADYSALEARIVAWLAGEDTLIGLFNDNLDVHTRNAEAIFGHKIDHKHNKEHKLKRDVLKNTLYGGLYGGSDETLHQTIVLDFPTVTLKMVQAMIRGLWKLYPRIPQWQKECVAFAEKHGFVEEPIHGRRIPMWRVDRNIAINHHGQGTAGAIVNIAVEGIDKEIDWDTHRLINHVHDELVGESKQPHVMQEIMVRNMVQTHTYQGRSMTFIVEPGQGKLWGEAKM